ncbi:MAG: hypothetical protein AAFW89_07665 [Bacteroidota bacterium]
MSEITQNDIDWLLNLNGANGVSTAPLITEKPEKKGSKFRIRPLRWLTMIGLFAAFSILPFFLLIRVSLLTHNTYGIHPWMALLAGMGSTVLFLLIYIFVAFARAKRKKVVAKLSLYASTLMVLGYCGYSLLYLSSMNAKTEAIQSVYTSLHPILRVAITTVTLADNELLITDISRTAEDYKRWGLPVNESSLHFKQDDGFVHAVDIRTKGHSELRNTLVEQSLRLMGLYTLRHTGTADHLHISIPRGK